MNFFDYLSSLPIIEKSIREEGYFVSGLSFDENYVREFLGIKEKYIDVAKVYIPSGANVRKHLHKMSTEYFISKDNLSLILNDESVTSSGIIKIPPNTPHSLSGRQTFYAIKAYDDFFDKEMV